MKKMRSGAIFVRFAVGLSLALVFGSGSRSQDQDFSKVEIGGRGVEREKGVCP